MATKKKSTKSAKKKVSRLDKLKARAAVLRKQLIKVQTRERKLRDKLDRAMNKSYDREERAEKQLAAVTTKIEEIVQAQRTAQHPAAQNDEEQ